MNETEKLALVIDASQAANGAMVFNNASVTITNSSTKAVGAVGGLSKGITNMKAPLMQISSLILGSAGTAGIVYGLNMLAKASSDSEEAMNKFNVVFGESRDEVRRWAYEYADAVGRSQKETVEWLASLQDTFVPLGFARDRAADLSKELVKLAVDVASFNNASDPEVINSFTSALVGNHEAVRRYGIVITESTLQQRAYQEGIRKNYNELTNLEKVQLRYNIIMDSTKDAQGDAIRTADSYANQVKRTKAELENYKVMLGDFVMPVQGAFVEILGDTVNYLRQAEDGVSGLSKEMEQLSTKIATFETLLQISETLNYVPEKISGLFKGEEVTANSSRYLQGKIDELSRLQKKLAEEEARGLLSPDARRRLENGDPFKVMQQETTALMDRLKAGEIDQDAYKKGYAAALERYKKSTADIPSGKTTDTAVTDTGITQNLSAMAEMEKAARRLKEKYDPFLVLQRETTEYMDMLNAGLIDQATYTEAYADSLSKYKEAVTENDKAVQDIFETLEFERSLLGKTNEERERAIDVMRMQKAAEEAYGEGTQKAIEAVQRYKEALEELDDARRLANNSLSNYYQELAYDMDHTAEYTASKVTDVFRTMESSMGNAFYSMMADGQSFRDAMQAFTQDITKAFMKMVAEMIARWMMFKALSFFGLGFSEGGVFEGGEPKQFAAGGAFMNGWPITAFATGGLVTQPTYFPMRSGIGLMGEAGPEAIMPLKRDSRGRLGVSSESGGVMIQNEIQVINQTSSPVKADVGKTTFDGQRYVTSIVLQDLNSHGPISQSLRNFQR